MKNYAEGRSNLFKKLKLIDEHLKHHTYLVGNTLTIADFAMYTYLSLILATHFDEK